MNLLLYLATVTLLFAAAVRRPSQARCPDGWRVDGVSPRGDFTCDEPYGCRDMRSARGGWTSTCDGALELRSRIYCTGTSRAIVVAGEAVGCQPRGWEP